MQAAKRASNRIRHGNLRKWRKLVRLRKRELLQGIARLIALMREKGALLTHRVLLPPADLDAELRLPIGQSPRLHRLLDLQQHITLGGIHM